MNGRLSLGAEYCPGYVLHWIPDMTNPIITKAPVDPEGELDKYLGICEQLNVWNPDTV